MEHNLRLTIQESTTRGGSDSALALASSTDRIVVRLVIPIGEIFERIALVEFNVGVDEERV